MILIATFPPAAPVVSGSLLTANRFTERPGFIARRLQEVSELGYIGNMLLPARVDAPTGAVGYEEADESIFPAEGPELVAPGSEYTLTKVTDGTAQVAAVAKYGKDGLISDELAAARGMQYVDKVLKIFGNGAAKTIDGAVVSTVASAVTATAAAIAKWDGSGTTPKILLDVLKAKAKISGLARGYKADALLIDDEVWAYLAADPTISAAMAREDKTNPIYSGRFEVLAGLEVIPVPNENLPLGLNSNAWVIDRGNLGFIVTQSLGGGYQPAGDLVEVKSWRTEETDGVRVRVRCNFKAVVTDPGAGYKISGVV